MGCLKSCNNLHQNAKLQNQQALSRWQLEEPCTVHGVSLSACNLTLELKRSVSGMRNGGLHLQQRSQESSTGGGGANKKLLSWQPHSGVGEGWTPLPESAAMGIMWWILPFQRLDSLLVLQLQLTHFHTKGQGTVIYVNRTAAWKHQATSCSSLLNAHR